MKKLFIVIAGITALGMTSCKKQKWCEYNCKWVHYTNGKKDYWSTTDGKMWQSDECRQSFVEDVTYSYSATTNSSYKHQKECSLQ